MSDFSDTNAKGVPFDGARAMKSGWDDRANPYPKGSVEAVEWKALWWGENAACFRSFVDDRPVLSWRDRAVAAEAKLEEKSK